MEAVLHTDEVSNVVCGPALGEVFRVSPSVFPDILMSKK